MTKLCQICVVVPVFVVAAYMTAACSRGQTGENYPAPVVRLVSYDNDDDDTIHEVLESQYRAYKRQLTTARMEELTRRQLSGQLSHQLSPASNREAFAASFGSPLGAAMQQFGYHQGIKGSSDRTPLGQFGNFQGVNGSFNGSAFQGGFCGSLGALGTSQATAIIDAIIDATEHRPGIVGSTGVGRAAELIAVVTKVVNPDKVVKPDERFVRPELSCIFNPFQLAPFGKGAGNQFGMMGTGPPPTPISESAPADSPPANAIEFFPPALTIIVRAPSRIHTSIYGGIISGKQKRFKAVMLDVQEGEAELDPATIWNETLAKGGVDAGMVIATADFLFEAGQFLHAAEFLKANLRAGIVVRPWVYKALAVALEASGADPDEISRATLRAAFLQESYLAKHELKPSTTDLWKLRGFHGMSGNTEIRGWAGLPGTRQD